MDAPSIYGWWLPPNVSANGAVIDQIIVILHVFMVVLFVGWGIFFVYCLFRFRQRPGHRASHENPHSKLPKFLEIAVVIFEAAVLVGLSYPAWSKLRTSFPKKEEATNIRIVAQQFAWNIQYPGKDGVFGKTDPKFVSDSNPIGLDMNDPKAKDDITTLNQLHFPVDKPVMAELSSKDVIHSFFIPVLRVKQDAIPGMMIPMWWQANKTGQYEIACAQLCGNGHTTMKGYVSIDTPEEYAAWMAEREKELAPPPPPAEPAPATQPAPQAALNTNQ